MINFIEISNYNYLKNPHNNTKNNLNRLLNSINIKTKIKKMSDNNLDQYKLKSIDYNQARRSIKMKQNQDDSYQ